MANDNSHLDLMDFVSHLFTTTWEKICGVVATIGVLTPVWHPRLSDISETASLWLPILGVIWLVLQIILKLVEFIFDLKSSDDE